MKMNDKSMRHITRIFANGYYSAMHRKLDDVEFNKIYNEWMDTWTDKSTATAGTFGEFLDIKEKMRMRRK